jgi:hypothetical protein
LVIGGWNGGGLNNCETFEPVGATWTAASTYVLPEWGISGFPSDAVGATQIGVGGKNVASTNCEEYSFAGDSWTALTSMPANVDRTHGGRLGDYGYVFGGGTLTVRRYNISGDSWDTAAPMTHIRSKQTAFVRDDDLTKAQVVAGDNVGDTAHNEEYDSVGDSWTDKVVLPAADSKLGGGAHPDAENAGYVFGGNSGSTDKTRKYDTVGDSWSSVGVLTTVAGNCCGIACGDAIYRCGGDPAQSNTDEFDTSGETWSSTTAMPTSASTRGPGSNSAIST